MMTGRDLIIYILENGLEDKEVLDGGKILGFETLYGLAEKKRRWSRNDICVM